MPSDSTTMVWDIEKGLPYPDQTFKHIHFRCGLEHIKNIGIITDEIYRVLIPGGTMYLRTDYAGYLPLYIFKSHEHNKALEVQYKDGIGYGHDVGEDSHLHLFVESHLDKLFRKFTIRKYNYIYGGRNKIITWLLKLLPKKLGAVHIELNAIK
jgi:ubiquinone/menaquinone biosynthesis C-methylase UbiE